MFCGHDVSLELNFTCLAARSLTGLFVEAVYFNIIFLGFQG